MPATQVEVLLKWNGSGGNGGGRGASDASGTGKPPVANGDAKKKNGEGPPKPTADTPLLKKMVGGVGKFVKNTLGLSFNTSAVLKQSQIFTSTVGVIFQLLGALVDVMLAPILPLIMPLIRLLGDQIPRMQKLMNGTIVPAITAIIDWGKSLFSKWDGSLGSLMGEDGIGGLGTKFTTWWAGTAMPWLQERTVEAKEYIGQKLVDMWDWFKDTGTRTKGWIITFFITQTGRLLGWLVTLPLKLWKFFLKIPGFLVRMVSNLIKLMFPIVGKLFTWIVGLGWKLITWVGGKVFGLGRAIVEPILKLPGLIYKGSLGLIEKIMLKLSSIVKTLPGIGGMLSKGLGGIGKMFGVLKNPKGMVEGIGKKLGGSKLLTALGGVAKMTKAIPVVGAVATAGFGAFEVGKAVAAGNYAKAGALATKTVAATTLTGLGFSAAGLATDIGGTLAANALFNKSPAPIAAAMSSPSVGAGFHPADQSINIDLTTNIVDSDGTVMEKEQARIRADATEKTSFDQSLGNSGHPSR